jgi:hypothetical protein
MILFLAVFQLFHHQNKYFYISMRPFFNGDLWGNEVCFVHWMHIFKVAISSFCSKNKVVSAYAKQRGLVWRIICVHGFVVLGSLMKRITPFIRRMNLYFLSKEWISRRKQMEDMDWGSTHRWENWEGRGYEFSDDPCHTTWAFIVCHSEEDGVVFRMDRNDNFFKHVQEFLSKNHVSTDGVFWRSSCRRLEISTPSASK